MFLAACCTSRAPWLLPIVTTAMEAGMRLGEVLGLTWEQIDLSRGVIRLERTGNERRPELPIRQAVYDLLAAMPEPRVGRLWPPRSMRTAFEGAVAAAEFDAPLTFHDLRHHFASWFVMRGGRLEALQQILGHATLAMTMRWADLGRDFVRQEMPRRERARVVAELALDGPGDPAPMRRKNGGGMRVEIAHRWPEAAHMGERRA
jgi:integrase